MLMRFRVLSYFEVEHTEIVFGVGKVNLMSGLLEVITCRRVLYESAVYITLLILALPYIIPKNTETIMIATLHSIIGDFLKQVCIINKELPFLIESA